MKKKIAYIVGAIVAILIVIVIVLVLNNQKYVVTFDMQNGEPKFEQLVKRGNKVYEPSDPKNEGYIFLGWYEGNELYDFTKVVKYNMTLVAKWEKDDYVKVSFETVGGNTIEPISVKKGEKVTRPIDPKKTGHTFKMWTLNGEAFDFETPITEDITLLATYEDVYSVYFDSNGGSEVASGTVKGGKIAKPEDPTRKGYKFLGWYLEDKAYDFNTEVKDNMTLKAKWLLENAYIGSREANNEFMNANSYISGAKFTTEHGPLDAGGSDVYCQFEYLIDKVIVGATKPTTGIVRSEDWSLAKDNSVKAYVVKSGTKYNLLIAAEDPRTIINLPSDSSYLFAYLFANSISFNSNVNSKNVISMSSMFKKSALNINLNNLDTSKVTDMSYMFAGFRHHDGYRGCGLGPCGFYFYATVSNKGNCRLFTFLDQKQTITNLDKLDTSRLKDITGMFSDLNIDTLDLSKTTILKYNTNPNDLVIGSNIGKYIVGEIAYTSEDVPGETKTDCNGIFSFDYVGTFDLSKTDLTSCNKYSIPENKEANFKTIYSNDQLSEELLTQYHWNKQ